jgi:ribosome recycling factor
MAHAVVNEAKSKMDKSIEAFQSELVSIRTGRASVGLLDPIDVEAYGTKMKLNQLGSVNAPEARLLTIQPFDKSQIPAIEKAILASPLDFTPANDGEIIRIPIPELSEERRREMVKLCGKLGEEAKVAIRNIRRHAVEEIKKSQKSGEIPEDDAHKLTADIQKVTDDHTHSIDDSLKAKEAEIMEV